MVAGKQTEGDAHKKKNKCDCCVCDDCVKELIELWALPVEGWGEPLEDKSV